jgi:hypothetical protein
MLGAQGDTKAEWTLSIEVVQITPHMLGFYDGRDMTGDPLWISEEHTWVTNGAMSLGIATYALYRRNTS